MVTNDGAEELVAAVDQGRVKGSDAAAIAGEPHAAQRALLELAESGDLVIAVTRAFSAP